VILLDTCALFWIECEQERIPARLRDDLARPENMVFASAISAFELGLKVRNGELELPLPAGDWVEAVCQRRGIRLLPLTATIAGYATTLPLIHKDPCDRFLIATAQIAKLVLASPDSIIRQYPDTRIVWAT
jgi:PIN domain nuclease of toxin-antitoxin system